MTVTVEFRKSRIYHFYTNDMEKYTFAYVDGEYKVKNILNYLKERFKSVVIKETCNYHAPKVYSFNFEEDADEAYFLLTDAAVEKVTIGEEHNG